MKKIYLYLIIAVVVLGTAGYFWFSGSSSNGVKYRTDKVTRGDITVNVRATGTINPVQTVEVGSQVSGVIEKMYVDFNSHVRKGQVIAQIDSTFLYASVKQAQANVERNQAQVNDAQRTLNRNTELFNKNLISQADLDASTTAFESAKASLKQTQAALDQAQVNLYYAFIRSPIDGVVISRDVDVGQTVASSFQTPKLFEIANDLTRMQVEASVDEADIGQIRDGQPVAFTVDAYPDEQFQGSVSQVRLSPINVQNVITYTVIIDVPNPDLKLRPGMTATVSILVDKRTNVLRVATLAARFQPSQDAAQKPAPAGTTGSQGTTQGAGQRDSSGNRRMMQAQDGRNGPGQGQAAANRMGRDGQRSPAQGRMADGQQHGPWDSPSGGGSDQPRVKMSRLWVLENGKTIRPVMVRTGLSDSRYVELITDELHEGDEIVIGYASSDVAGGSNGQNPFAPRMMGPPGGGGRR